MMQYAYSPDTGELINTDTPAAWMKTTTAAPPTFDPQAGGCFWKNGAWVIVTADQLTPAKSAQISILEAAYNSAIQLPVAYMSTTFQADAGSQDVLTKCLVAGSVPAGFYWLDANNAQVVMTFAQLQGLAGAMLVQGQTAFAHLQAKKSAVKAVTTTVADVQAVVW
jgi:hypothetical protein